MSEADAFVDIRNLTVRFTGGRRPVQAVGGVDLQVRRGEVVALIGESGSGKSVTLRSLLRLHAPRRATPTPGRCWAASRRWTRTAAPSSRRWPATRPTRLTHRRAAASTRAA